MKTPLRVLLVEDSVDDADLLLGELRRAGFSPSWTRVETEPDFVAEMAKAPDIILSDYSMPSFNGLRAATLLRSSGFDIPFILISGTVGEDVAVEAMRLGATDYLLKDRIARLGPAVERALRDALEQRERLRVETALYDMRAQLQKTLEHSAVVIYSLRVNGTTVIPQMVNENITRLLGYSVEECSTHDWWVAHLHPDDRDEQVAAIADTLSSDALTVEYRLQHKSGHYLWLADHRRTMRDARGIPVEISGVWMDITARKLSELSLETQHRRHTFILDSVDEGIQGLDRDGNITFENKASARMFGWEACELIGRSAHALMHHSYADGSAYPDALCPIHATLAHGTSRRVDDEVFWRKDGTSFPVEYVSAPKLDDHGNILGAVVVFHDIAERRSLEAQFRQAQKLESVGQLAGGIAHDFNNIISVVMLHAELISSVEGTPPEVRAGLAEIMEAAERAANLTRQLLLFSRKQVMQPRQLELNSVVTSLVRMLQRIVPEDVSLELHLHSGPLFTYADAGMLDQVLMNLTVNARDAMPRGGRLIIETSERHIDAAQAMLNPEATVGRFVWLRVTDTGEGIPPEIRSRIFEPFFTTKEAGKGTGLGLATVFGVIKQHHGWLEVSSEVNAGTTIEIFLPASDVLPGSTDSTDIESPAPRGRSETVLIAEDDPRVRKLTRMVLERAGYQVLEAADGMEAERVWRAHEGEVALLLTDLVMPGELGGRELALRMQTEQPTLTVLFTSGYSADIAGRELKLLPGQRFVQKPCHARQLLDAVRQTLDG